MYICSFYYYYFILQNWDHIAYVIYNFVFKSVLTVIKGFFFFKGCKDKLHLVVEWHSITWTLTHRIASVEEYKNRFNLSSPLNVFYYLDKLGCSPPFSASAPLFMEFGMSLFLLEIKN